MNIILLCDPRISDSYRRALHRQFELHKVYQRVNTISMCGKAADWSIDDEDKYEGLDRDIGQAMVRVELVCSTRNLHTKAWSKSIGRATHGIKYWDMMIKRGGTRDPTDDILNYTEGLNKDLSLAECHHQASNVRAKLNDVVTEAITYGTSYELEVATMRIHKRFPKLFENTALEQEREDLIQKTPKFSENRRYAQRSFKKLGQEIRGQVRPYSVKKSFITALDVPGEDGIWRNIEGKDVVEYHIIDRNIVQFSHAGKTPFGYSDLSQELEHTGDSPMADAMFDGNIVHDALGYPAIIAIVDQLKKHPLIESKINPIVTTEDFKSAFECVPEKILSPPPQDMGST
jgi:hypothetical protein